jgi:hypothetical protein
MRCCELFIVGEGPFAESETGNLTVWGGDVDVDFAGRRLFRCNRWKFRGHDVPYVFPTGREARIL